MEEKAFELFDLRVEVVGSDKPMVCNHPEGAYFLVWGVFCQVRFQSICFPQTTEESRGAVYRGRLSRHSLVFGRSRIGTMMHSYASAVGLRSGGSILVDGM